MTEEEQRQLQSARGADHRETRLSTHPPAMVRINDEMLKKCTFTEDLGAVKELTLTNK